MITVEQFEKIKIGNKFKLSSDNLPNPDVFTVVYYGTKAFYLVNNMSHTRFINENNLDCWDVLIEPDIVDLI